MLLENGRFAFLMHRYWGDLRKLFDLRMKLNYKRYNFRQRPPYDDAIVIRTMWQVAPGMWYLHGDNIIHRDLKASNVLVRNANIDIVSFDPEQDYDFVCSVANYECSTGVVGTGFWRAPEILLGVKNVNITPDLFTKKSDVYSYAMTCYEIITGEIPFEDIRATDYDIVIGGRRSKLPRSIKPWLKALLDKCWHHDTSERPNFEEINEIFRKHDDSGNKLHMQM